MCIRDRSKAQRLRPQHKNFGQQSTSNRLTLLNQGRQQKINQTINDLVDEQGVPTGTQVILRIPYKVVTLNDD